MTAEDRPRRSRPGAPSRGRWWRPRGTFGRILLASAALVTVSALGIGIYAAKTFLGRDSRFRIPGAGNIQSAGLNEVSRADLLPVFGEDIGRNVFFIPLEERRRQVEKIPWVERATVMRLLPDRLSVEIVERRPVAFVRQGSVVRLVDGSGVLLDMPAVTMAQRHYSFPVVTGIDPADPPAARKGRMAVYQRLLADLDSGPQKLSDQLSEIDLTDPEDARVLMPEPGGDVLAHFGSDQFFDRYQRYRAHIAEWRQQYPHLSSVDLRYERQVVLEMAQGGGPTQAMDADAPASAARPADAKADAARPVEKKPAESKPAAAKAAPEKIATAKPVAAPAEKPGAQSKTAATKPAAKTTSAANVQTKPAGAKSKSLPTTATAKAKSPAAGDKKSAHTGQTPAGRKNAKNGKKSARQLAEILKERDRKRARAKKAAMARQKARLQTATQQAPAAGSGE